MVLLHENFMHYEGEAEHTCLVFETLGKSLFDFIKNNRYLGFGLHQIQNIARQSLEGVMFMHEKMGLTHTDLKPENILLKLDTRKKITDQSLWPVQVRNKKEIYDGEKCDSDDSDYGEFSEEIGRDQIDGCTGGNVGDSERHSGIESNIVTTSEELRRRRNRFREKVWMKPIDDTVKIIDFGGATYQNE